MRAAKSGMVAAAFVACIVAGAGQAHAGGFATARFGGEHGHPTTTNATAIYYNPAGIGFSEGYHVFVDTNLAWRKLTYEHETRPVTATCTGASNCADDPSAPDGANNGRGELFNILASPMLGVTGKFGDFALGAGFYTPFGGRGSWKKNDDFKDDATYPGPYDGPQRWYAISGEIISSFITLAAAYHIKPARLSIGVSGNLILSNTHTVRAKTVNGTNEVGSEGRSVLDVKGTDWSVGLGVMYEAIENQLWLGASWQSQPNITGKKPEEGKFKFYIGGSETEEDAELESDLPDIYRLGGRYRPTQNLELRLFGDYTRWSVMKRQCVYKKGASCNVNDAGVSTDSSVLFNQPRDWNDTFGIRAGASTWVSKPVEVFAGLGYNSNAVPDETLEPALPDWNSVTAAIGGRFQLIEKIFAAVSYTQFIYIPRDTNGKFTVDDRFTGQTHNPDAGGNYKQMVGVVNVNVDIGF